MSKWGLPDGKSPFAMMADEQRVLEKLRDCALAGDEDPLARAKLTPDECHGLIRLLWTYCPKDGEIARILRGSA